MRLNEIKALHLNKMKDNEKQELRTKIYDGARCPCCNQFAKVYKRRLYSAPARALISLYRRGRWSHVNDFESGQVALLKHWGLVQEKLNVDTKKTNSGIWAITMEGIDFVKCFSTVRSHIVLYDAKFIKFHGPHVDIRHCLGKNFNYGELMNG